MGELETIAFWTHKIEDTPEGSEKLLAMYSESQQQFDLLKKK